MEMDDENGGQVKAYRFSAPATASVSLNPTAFVKVALPPAVTGKVKLEMAQVPSGWQMKLADDGALVLSQNDATVRVKYILSLQQVGVICSGIDGSEAQHRLDALKAEYTKAEAELMSLQRRATDTAIVSKSSWQMQIAAKNQQVYGLRNSITEATRAMRTGNPEKTIGSTLEGAVVALTLPNGVEVARVTIAGSQPAPQALPQQMPVKKPGSY